MRHLRLAFFLAALSAFGSSSAAAQYTTCPAASPTDRVDDTQNLNACLSQGGIVDLFPGDPGYLIGSDTYPGNGLVLTVDGTRLINSHGGYARINAHADLRKAMLDASADNFEIAYLQFDGNKANRTWALECGQTDRKVFSNVVTNGSGFLVHDIVSQNTLCGTALGVSGTSYEIFRNTIQYNGRTLHEPGGPDRWSDGITAGSCIGGRVHDNDLIDNSDVDLISGGAQNCSFTNNHIYHYRRYGFAGLMLAWFQEGGGNFRGSVFSGNTVWSAYDKLAIGIMVGPHPWDRNLNIRYAFVTNNSSTGAVVNLAVDGAYDVTVQGNSVLDAQGTTGFNCTGHPANYTTAHGSGSIQSGARGWKYDSGTPCAGDLAIVPRGHDVLRPDESLGPNEYRASLDGQHLLVYQAGDGNLVLYGPGTIPWASHTSHNANITVMQADGNLVSYDAKWNWRFASWTHEYGGAWLVVESGRIAIYDAFGIERWYRP